MYKQRQKEKERQSESSTNSNSHQGWHVNEVRILLGCLQLLVTLYWSSSCDSWTSFPLQFWWQCCSQLMASFSWWQSTIHSGLHLLTAELLLKCCSEVCAFVGSAAVHLLGVASYSAASMNPLWDKGSYRCSYKQIYKWAWRQFYNQLFFTKQNKKSILSIFQKKCKLNKPSLILTYPSFSP